MNSDQNELTSEDILLEALPDDVLATMEARDRWMGSLQYTAGSLEFLVADLQAWTPGQTVRVAFLGGSQGLYEAIEAATVEIAAHANITLDFRDNGDFRTWTTSDTEYAAEIRVSLDQQGYFSLVGTDSVNPDIGPPTGPVGGRPHQRTLNLSRFDVALPNGAVGTIRHEFLHALAFHHEHQNMRGPCEAAFRWEDDPGYQPTKDSRGAYIADANGLRPGIYTYLSGFPNWWSRARVDFNLRTQADNPAVVAGPFDPASVMLYRFSALFYHTQPSPCAPTGNGEDLSQGDKRALALLYPQTAESLNEIASRREELVGALEASGRASAPGSGRLESAGETPDFAARYLARLRESLSVLRGD